MSFVSGYQKLNWYGDYSEAAYRAKSLRSEYGCDILIQVGGGGWEVWVPNPVYRDIQAELRLNFQVQHPHIGALPCPEPTTT